MNLERLKRNGIISEEIRKRLNEIVQESGSTKAQLARMLGISVVTLYKWLNGSTDRCSIASRRKVLDIMEGKSLLRPTPGTRYSPYPNEILMCMERVGKAYDLCSTSEEKARGFIQLIDHAAINAVREFAYDEQEAE